jgi:hypothetical protein
MAYAFSGLWPGFPLDAILRFAWRTSGNQDPTLWASLGSHDTDIPAGLQEVKAGITTPGAYLRSLLGKTVFSVLDWRDPLPVLGDFASAVIRSLSKHGKDTQAQAQVQENQQEQSVHLTSSREDSVSV